MQFKEEEYKVSEEDGVVRTFVVRTGDTSEQSEVRCFTRQATAKVGQDFEERPDTNDSLIIFNPGQLTRGHQGVSGMMSYAVLKHALPHARMHTHTCTHTCLQVVSYGVGGEG